jgi:hypothetical protein
MRKLLHSQHRQVPKDRIAVKIRPLYLDDTTCYLTLNPIKGVQSHKLYL